MKLLYKNKFSERSPKYDQMMNYVDFIVIHRSCSSFLVSVNRVSPALALAMMPALLTSESVSVLLPWSTWAITDMLRIFARLSMIARTCPGTRQIHIRDS